MTENPPTGHETPEQRTALEEAFTRLVRGRAATPTAERLADMIRDRQDARRSTTNTPRTTDTTED